MQAGRERSHTGRVAAITSGIRREASAVAGGRKGEWEEKRWHERIWTIFTGTSAPRIYSCAGNSLCKRRREVLGFICRKRNRAHAGCRERANAVVA